MKILKTSTLLLCLLTLSVVAEERENIAYRFVYAGCNRVGFEVPMSANPSTANVEQLVNTFNEVAAMEPRPSYFFFVGDLIRGYTSLLSTLEQLRAWKALHQKSELYNSGVALVPVVGNHEVLLSSFKIF